MRYEETSVRRPRMSGLRGIFMLSMAFGVDLERWENSEFAANADQ